MPEDPSGTRCMVRRVADQAPGYAVGVSVKSRITLEQVLALPEMEADLREVFAVLDELKV